MTVTIFTCVHYRCLLEIVFLSNNYLISEVTFQICDFYPFGVSSCTGACLQQALPWAINIAMTKWICILEIALQLHCFMHFLSLKKSSENRLVNHIKFE